MRAAPCASVSIVATQDNHGHADRRVAPDDERYARLDATMCTIRPMRLARHLAVMKNPGGRAAVYFPKGYWRVVSVLSYPPIILESLSGALVERPPRHPQSK